MEFSIVMQYMLHKNKTLLLLCYHIVIIITITLIFMHNKVKHRLTYENKTNITKALFSLAKT